MVRGKWLAALALGLLGLGVAVRLQRPPPGPALDCAPSRVRVDGEGVARCAPLSQGAPPSAGRPSGAGGAVAEGAEGGAADAGRPPGAVALLALGGRLDLNTASEEDLAAVPGVGPALARALVQARTGSGGFGSWDAVDGVPGVGPAKLALLQAHTEIR